jgi:hypothetical protein
MSTMSAYGIDSLSVNMFTLVYPFFFIPGSILAIGLYARYGLGYCIIVGALLNFLACWIRTIGGYYSLNWNYNFDVSQLPADAPLPNGLASYNIQLFGQIIGAFGQPLLLNVPPRCV